MPKSGSKHDFAKKNSALFPFKKPHCCPFVSNKHWLLTLRIKFSMKTQQIQRGWSWSATPKRGGPSFSDDLLFNRDLRQPRACVCGLGAEMLPAKPAVLISPVFHFHMAQLESWRWLAGMCFSRSSGKITTQKDATGVDGCGERERRDIGP